MTTKRNPPKVQPDSTPALRVSQLELTMILLNEHDAPVRPDPLVFMGSGQGSAADQLIAWLQALPTHLAQATPPDSGENIPPNAD
jgi:hypothetical protein